MEAGLIHKMNMEQQVWLVLGTSNLGAPGNIRFGDIFLLFMEKEDLFRAPESNYISTFLMWQPGWLSRYSDSLRAARSWDRIPVGGDIFRTNTDRLWGSPRLLYSRYRVFPGDKAAGGCL